MMAMLLQPNPIFFQRQRTSVPRVRFFFVNFLNVVFLKFGDQIFYKKLNPLVLKLSISWKVVLKWLQTNLKELIVHSMRYTWSKDDDCKVTLILIHLKIYVANPIKHWKWFVILHFIAHIIKCRRVSFHLCHSFFLQP